MTAVERLFKGGTLGARDAEQLFAAMIGGEICDAQVAGALVALRVRGEQVEELTGAARALRAAGTPFDGAPADSADCCGTGGDGAGTLNISTGAAFVAAACGQPMVKHGNRSVSSRCGSADVLEALGATIELPPARARRTLAASGVAYLHAPLYHPGIGRVMAVRRALGTRTIFNALGPLLNPARPRFQLVGVYDPALCRPLAETLHELGCRGALVVHGDGLDEFALHGPTRVARLANGQVEESTLTPADLGLESQPLAALAGGDPATNARALRAALAGRGAPAHAAALAANAGLLLWCTGRAVEPAAGVRHALAAIERGTPAEHLARFVEASRDAG